MSLVEKSLPYPSVSNENRPYDNSFIGDITDKITTDENGTMYLYDKPITIEKLTPEGMLSLAIEVIKGVFYLPANPSHVGIIQRETTEPDGSEIRTRCKYIIYPSEEASVPLELKSPAETSFNRIPLELKSPAETSFNRIPLSKFTPEMLSDNELDLVRKTLLFAWIIKYNNLNENSIEFSTCGAGTKFFSLRIPILKRQTSVARPGEISAFPRELIRKWFANNLGDMASPQMLDSIFERAVAGYLKPYRSAVTLRYKFDKLLYKYNPNGIGSVGSGSVGSGPDTFSVMKSKFINDIMKHITPTAREAVKEPIKRFPTK